MSKTKTFSLIALLLTLIFFIIKKVQGELSMDPFSTEDD